MTSGGQVSSRAEIASSASAKGKKKRNRKRLISAKKLGPQVEYEQFEKLEDKVTLLKAELDMIKKQDEKNLNEIE